MLILFDNNRSKICANEFEIDIGRRLFMSLIDFDLSFFIGMICVTLKSFGTTP